MFTNVFSKHAPLGVLFALAASGATMLGCSSDNAKPTGPIIIGSSGGGDAGPLGSGGAAATGGGSSSGGKANGTGGASNASGGNSDGGDAGPSSGGDGGLTPDSGPECNPDAGTNGCYPCPPQTLIQYLNQCTGSQCQKFDNAVRLGASWNNGNIPQVP